MRTILCLLLVSSLAYADTATDKNVAIVLQAERLLGNPGDADLAAFKKKVDRCSAEPICQSALRAAETKWISAKIAYFGTWIENVKKPGKGLADGEVAIQQADQCRAAVDSAIAAGAAPSAQIKLRSGDKLTLAEAKVKVCDAVAAAGQGVVDAEHAKEEAKKAPFRKVLTGDKMALLDNLWGDAFYGPGGTSLETPEDFANASVWYDVLTWTDDSDLHLLTHWTVRKYVFHGDTAVGDAQEKSGCCDAPSSGDFQ